jgi:hypothetical protein
MQVLMLSSSTCAGDGSGGAETRRWRNVAKMGIRPSGSSAVASIP